MSLSVSSLSIKERIRYFFKFYHKHLLITFLICVAMIGISTFCGVGDGILNFAKDMITDMCQPNTFDKIRNELNVTIGTDANIGGTAIPGLGGILSNINSTVEGLAGGLLGILFMISLGTYVMNNPQPSIQVLVVRFVMLIVSLALVNNSMEISTYIGNLGTELVNSMGATISAETASPQDIIKDIQENGDKSEEEGAEEADNRAEMDLTDPDEDAAAISKNEHGLAKYIKKVFNLITGMLSKVFSYIGVVLAIFVPWIIIKVATALCSVFTISRAVELIILAVLSPIPAALMLNDPFGSGSFTRFLKNLGALALQGVVMLVIAYICQAMLNNIVVSCGSYEDLKANCWTMVGISIAEVGLLAKSLGISQKLVGIQ